MLRFSVIILQIYWIEPGCELHNVFQGGVRELWGIFPKLLDTNSAFSLGPILTPIPWGETAI